MRPAVDAIAARAGICRRLAQNAMREAARQVVVQERRREGRRNDYKVVRIISADKRFAPRILGLANSGKVDDGLDGNRRLIHRPALIQRLEKSPAVQWQKDDVQDQYGRQVQHKCIRDEGYVAANGDDAKVDHVLHTKCGQHQGGGNKPDCAAVR